jgi:hypothetical protein
MAGPSKSLVAGYVVVGGFALLILAVQSANSDDVPGEPIPVAGPAAKAPASITDEVVSHPTVSSYIGVSSCAASGCHGAVAVNDGFSVMPDEQIWRSSYVIWAAHKDPHREAYHVLHGELADDIVRKLAGAKRVAKGEKKTWLEAHKDRRCLSCHATVDFTHAKGPITVDAAGETPDPTPNRAPDQWLNSALLHEGVGCESCHGAAKDWVGKHFLYPGPNPPVPVPPEEVPRLQELGMIDTDQLGLQAQQCTGCHIGNRDGRTGEVRDMNHDMIAAGHPPLYFDFAGYKARLPRHWRVPSPDKYAEKEYDSWSAGKLAAAAAQLKLSAGRHAASQASTPQAVWPEFSEYDCFACHHALRSSPNEQATPRQAAAERRAVPVGKQVWGSWSSWHLSQVNSVTSLEGPDWNRITVDLESPFAPAAKINERMAAAGAVADTLSARAAGQKPPAAPLTADEYRQQLIKIADEASKNVAGWENAVQYYLRCFVVYRAWRISSNKSLKEADDPMGEALVRLYQKLKYSNDKSPRFQSPANYSSTVVAAAFEDVVTAAKEHQP